MKNRKYLLLLFLLVFTILGCKKDEPQNSFRFVFMTDIHVQPEKDGNKGFSQAIKKVNELKPDFVITGGDLIMDALGQSYERADSLYNLYDELLKEFKMPVYNTLGNHEVFGLYKSSGINPDHEVYGKEMFKKRLNYNKRFTLVEQNGWVFMLLDCIGFTEERQYYGIIDSIQIDWIKEKLKTIDKTTPIVISSHIPFISARAQYENGGTAPLSAGVAVANSHEVIELFKDHNLKIVLQGHLHVIEEIVINGIHFITGGAVSAAWWSGPYKGFDEGFVVVDVTDNQFEWHYETYGWKAVQE